MLLPTFLTLEQADSAKLSLNYKISITKYTSQDDYTKLNMENILANIKT